MVVTSLTFNAPPPAQVIDASDVHREYARNAIVISADIEAQSGLAVTGTVNKLTAEFVPGNVKTWQSSDPVVPPDEQSLIALLS